MKKILLFLAAAVATISCSTDNLSDANSSANKENSIKLSIPVSVSSTADTRVAVSDDNNGGYAVKWSADDKMGAWSNQLFGNTSFNEFAIEKENFDENESIFTGAVKFGSYATTIRFVYPYSSAPLYKYNNSNEDDKDYCNAFDIDLSEQTVSADLSHLGANSYMVSNEIAFDVENNTDEKSITPEMSHMGAAIDLNLACTEAQQKGYTLEYVEVSYAAMPSSVLVNLQESIEGTYFEAKAYEPITLTVDAYTANDKGVFPVIPFNVFPFTFAEGGEMTITATFADADANFYTGTRVLTSTADVAIERATRNSLYAIISDALVGADAPAVGVYTLVEDAAEITDGEYLLACDYNNVMYIADGSAGGKNIMDADAKGYDYYTSATKSFESNATTDGYAVTIKTVSGGVNVIMGNGAYATNTGKSKMGFTSNAFTWSIKSDSDYGVRLHSTKSGDTNRAIGFNYNQGGIRFSTYGPSSTFPAANLYKKTGSTGGSTEDPIVTTTVTSDDFSKADTYYKGYGFEYTTGDYDFACLTAAGESTPNNYSSNVRFYEGNTFAVANNQLDALNKIIFTLEEGHTDASAITCSNGTFEIDATDESGLTYIWTGDATAVTFTNSGSTVYIDSVEITSAELTDDTDEEYIYYPPFISSLSENSLSFLSAGSDIYEVTINGLHLDSAIYSNNYEGSQFVIDIEGETITIYAEENAGDAITETVDITVEGGNTVSLTLLQDAFGTVKDQTMTITYESGTINGYDSFGDRYSGDMELEGAMFNLVDIYNYDSKIAVSKESGSLANTTPFEGLSKMVIEYSSSDYATIYEGTATNPTATKVTPTSTAGNVCVYEISAGNEFFAIKNISNKYVNILSIDITYSTLGEAPASFTGLSYSNYEFDYSNEEGDVLPVQILGSNLENAESITVTIDNTENFSVGYTKGNTEFNVGAINQNHTDQTYRGTITVNVDGTIHTMTVSQKGELVAEPTLVTTLTKSILNKAYGTYNKTQDGIEFHFDQVADFDQGKNMQFKSGKGYMYNSTEISGLSKIVITKTSGEDMNLPMYVGSSENPNSKIEPVESGDTYTYTITNGSTYFTLGTGSGASYIASIEIYAIQ